MPVTFIKGPTGLSKEGKKELIEGTLQALTNAYQMPDDRVYIDEVSFENVGHTPLLRPFCRSLTEKIGQCSRSPRGSSSR